MEEILEPENLRAALKHVRERDGAPGVDGMTAEELPAYLREHWPTIREQLMGATYRPLPVRRVEIPKPDGGMRRLGVPCILDRFIQQAVQRVLHRHWDPTFSEHSYGFRPNRNQHQAVAKAQAYLADGFRFVVDLDIEKFFDRVNHDVLMGRVAARVEDKRLLRLIRACLEAGVMENGLESPTEEGTPQGGPLSPILSNLLLDDLDRELERRGHRFVRFADDCNIYVRSERAGHRVMETVTRFLRDKLRLKVNEKKSAVGRPWKRKFLGFSFTGGTVPKRRISPESRERFEQRIRELTPRAGGHSVRTMISRLSVYLRGWWGYYRYCETPSVPAELDGWIRRRLRGVIWKNWKHSHARYLALRQLKLPPELATQVVGSPGSYWRKSRHSSVQAALPASLFRRLGLYELAPAR
jgi:RNA-directed DNA polymerase